MRDQMSRPIVAKTLVAVLESFNYGGAMWDLRLAVPFNVIKETSLIPPRDHTGDLRVPLSQADSAI